MGFETLKTLLRCAASARLELLNEPRHLSAFRLFHGFTEGFPALTVDVLARTLVLHDYSAPGEAAFDARLAAEFLRGEFPFLDCAVLKRRSSPNPEERCGTNLFGTHPADCVSENGVRYAANPLLNADTGFYSDTRELRRYLAENSAGKRVLNTFAYTGSLGIAALVGGAADVLQTDRSTRYMELAYRSASLNGKTLTRKNFRTGDFFRVTAALRKEKREFDTVILDPPYFTQTAAGTVDTAQQFGALINKVRPLVADGGTLIVVCNALYLSGEAFLAELEALGHDGYLTLERTIPIPVDAAGAAPDFEAAHVANPAPFNHPTKIAVLRVRKK